MLLTASPVMMVSPTVTWTFSPNMAFMPLMWILFSRRLCSLYSRKGRSWGEGEGEWEEMKGGRWEGRGDDMREREEGRGAGRREREQGGGRGAGWRGEEMKREEGERRE